MSIVEGADVSRHAFSVAYHGDVADDHAMDVEALAPALLAFGRPIRESNSEINSDRAAVKVLVPSDFEHKCFNINFELVQTILQGIKDLLGDQNTKTASDPLKTSCRSWAHPSGVIEMEGWSKNRTSSTVAGSRRKSWRRDHQDRRRWSYDCKREGVC